MQYKFYINSYIVFICIILPYIVLKNIFDPQLVETMDVKPVDTESCTQICFGYFRCRTQRHILKLEYLKVTVGC